MYFKLSNTCSIQTFQKEFDRSFRFPHIYKKSNVIDGTVEQIIPIIISENPDEITFGIWGALPKDFRDDWKKYQQIKNTLTTKYSEIGTEDISNFGYKRCVVLVSGFFTNMIRNGQIYTYYVHAGANRPLILAGLYNKLDDGFLTFTLVLTKASKFINKINNVSNTMPWILSKMNMNEWINGSKTPRQFEYTNNKCLLAHTISQHFDEKKIIADNALKPISFDILPNFLSSEISTTSPNI